MFVWFGHRSEMLANGCSNPTHVMRVNQGRLGVEPRSAMFGCINVSSLDERPDLGAGCFGSIDDDNQIVN